MTIDLTTWYYTLSTIAQALAAVLGLGAVFVTLRLQSIGNDIRKYKTIALEILQLNKTSIPPNEEAKLVRDHLKSVLEGYDQYAKERDWGTNLDKIRFRSEPQGNPNLKEFVSRTWKNLDKYVEQRDDMVELVKWPGIMTLLAICVSLVLLAFTDWIHMTSFVKVLLLSEITLAVFSLWSIARASWKLLTAFEMF